MQQPNEQKVASSESAPLARNWHALVSESKDSLDLSNEEIDDADAMAIAKALDGNKALRRLNLSHNDIGEAGIQEIAFAVRFSGLVACDLSNNPFAYDAGTIERLLSMVATNNNLAELVLDVELHNHFEVIQYFLKKKEARTCQYRFFQTHYISHRDDGVDGGRSVERRKK